MLKNLILIALLPFADALDRFAANMGLALYVTTYGSNPQIPGISSDTFVPDQLIAGNLKLVTDSVTITGSADLVRGTVLGKITIGAATSATKSGGNTGTGTLVLDVTTPTLASVDVGVYTVRCIQAVVNGGVFEVKSPSGRSLGEAIIPAGAGDSVTFSDQVKFVLTDAGTDFIVGDGFDITVAAGSGSYKTSVKTATDGSQAPVAILVDQALASGGDLIGGIYLMGEFNAAKIVFDSGWGSSTAGPVALAPLLRPLGIFLKNAITAGDPS